MERVLLDAKENAKIFFICNMIHQESVKPTDNSKERRVRSQRIVSLPYILREWIFMDASLSSPVAGVMCHPRYGSRCHP